MKSSFSALVRVQLLSLFGINKLISSKDKKEKRKYLLFFVGMIFVTIILLGYMAMISVGYAVLGLVDSIPVIMLFAACLTVFITSTVKANGFLYGGSDYDLLMSYPVPTVSIIVSKFFVMYLLDLLFTLGVLVPSVIVYAAFTAPKIGFYIMLVPMLLLSPLIPLVVASFFGAAIAFISSKFRKKSLITVLFSLLTIVAVFGIEFLVINSDFSGIAGVLNKISEVFAKVYPPAGWFGTALTENNPLYALLFCAVSLVLFALLAAILARTYKSVNNSLYTTRAHRNFKLSAQHSSGVLTSLFKRDLKRYFSSAIYVTNTITGAFLYLALAVVACFFPLDSIELEGVALGGLISQLTPLVPLFFIGLMPTTSACISIEGKSIWILRSLPVRVNDILNGKRLVNYAIMLPAIVVGGVLLVISTKAEPLTALLTFLTPTVYLLFSTETALFSNLKFPNFEWKNEAQIVKQGAAALLSMLFGMATSIIPIIVVFSINADKTLLIAAFTVITAAATALFYRINSRSHI